MGNSWVFSMGRFATEWRNAAIFKFERDLEARWLMKSRPATRAAVALSQGASVLTAVEPLATAAFPAPILIMTAG
jgi:hypothetical protein